MDWIGPEKVKIRKRRRAQLNDMDRESVEATGLKRRGKTLVKENGRGSTGNGFSTSAI